eukprot:1736211-Rhodomonas_salina.1
MISARPPILKANFQNLLLCENTIVETWENFPSIAKNKKWSCCRRTDAATAPQIAPFRTASGLCGGAR